MQSEVCNDTIFKADFNMKKVKDKNNKTNMYSV